MSNDGRCKGALKTPNSAQPYTTEIYIKHIKKSLHTKINESQNVIKTQKIWYYYFNKTSPKL